MGTKKASPRHGAMVLNYSIILIPGEYLMYYSILDSILYSFLSKSNFGLLISKELDLYFNQFEQLRKVFRYNGDVSKLLNKFLIPPNHIAYWVSKLFRVRCLRTQTD